MAQKRIYITSGTTWVIPADYNAQTSVIDCFGPGGGGGAPTAGSNPACGGGGGAFARISGLALQPGTVISIQVGAAGVGGTQAGAGASGTDTWFNGTSLANCSVGAKAGANGTTGAAGGGAGGSAAASVGTTKFSGGNGGNITSTGTGGSGGGGAAGPDGNGSNGGTNNQSAMNAGSGGGGNGGGSTSAGNPSQNSGVNSHGGQGGTAEDGTAGGLGGALSDGLVGTNGSGGGGGAAHSGTLPFNGAVGGTGDEYDASHGSGGGGGGAGDGGSGGAGATGGAGGGFGGGGGGAGQPVAAGNGTSGSGAAGAIVVTYTPSNDENFQDLVVQSYDSIFQRGAYHQIGVSSDSTVSYAWSASGGIAVLAASPTTSGTLWMPAFSSQQTLGLLTALSAGTQLASTGVAVLSNSNGVTFGMSNNTVTASVASSLTAINLSAGTTSNNLSAFTLSNSNNLSFGLNASTVTASYAFNLSAGTTSNNLNSVTFSNANGLSFGLNASTITGSHAINVSAGTTSNNLTALTLSNSYNVSFGLNASTLTASANLTGDWYDNVANAQPVATGTGAIGAIAPGAGAVSSLFVGPLQGFGEDFPFDLTANTIFFPDVSISGSTATMSIAFTSIWNLGIYTLNGSSLSLLNSAQYSFGFGAAATNNSTGFAGVRYGTFGSTAWSSSPVFRYGSKYWLAWFFSTAGAFNQTLSMLGGFNYSTGQRSGVIGNSNLTGTSNGAAPFYGIYSAQTAALPASIGSNQLQKTASLAAFVPHLIMANNASLTVF